MCAFILISELFSNISYVKVTWSLLRDLLLEYVEDVDDDDSTSRPTPAFLSALSNLIIEGDNHDECAYDTHILSFILSRALKLDSLEISFPGIDLDHAFTQNQPAYRR